MSNDWIGMGNDPYAGRPTPPPEDGVEVHHFWTSLPHISIPDRDCEGLLPLPPSPSFRSFGSNPPITSDRWLVPRLAPLVDRDPAEYRSRVSTMHPDVWGKMVRVAAAATDYLIRSILNAPPSEYRSTFIEMMQKAFDRGHFTWGGLFLGMQQMTGRSDDFRRIASLERTSVLMGHDGAVSAGARPDPSLLSLAIHVRYAILFRGNYLPLRDRFGKQHENTPNYLRTLSGLFNAAKATPDAPSLGDPLYQVARLTKPEHFYVLSRWGQNFNSSPSIYSLSIPRDIDEMLTVTNKVKCMRFHDDGTFEFLEDEFFIRAAKNLVHDGYALSDEQVERIHRAQSILLKGDYGSMHLLRNTNGGADRLIELIIEFDDIVRDIKSAAPGIQEMFESCPERHSLRVKDGPISDAMPGAESAEVTVRAVVSLWNTHKYARGGVPPLDQMFFWSKMSKKDQGIARSIDAMDPMKWLSIPDDWKRGWSS